MNIQKDKVLKNCEWSVATQKKLASMLGVTALLSLSGTTLSACDLGSNVTSGDVAGPEFSSSSENLPPESGVAQPEPTCGEVPCDGEFPPSSSSFQEPYQTSGIVGPNDNYSSSSFEQQQSSSSSEEYPPFPPQAGTIAPPEDLLSSSSYAVDSLEITSGEIAPLDTLEPEAGSPVEQVPESDSVEVALKDTVHKNIVDTIHVLPLAGVIAEQPVEKITVISDSVKIK